MEAEEGCGVARSDGGLDDGGEVYGDDDSEGDSDDPGAGAGSRLIRRRTSGLVSCGGAGRFSPYGGRSLWAVAQDAGDLSQSKFYTGVFADFRADRGSGDDGGGSGDGEVAAKGAATVTEVTAAAYGDPSLYNRRPARRSTIGATPASSLVANADVGRIRHPESCWPIRDGGQGRTVVDVAGEREDVVGERRWGENEAGAEEDDASRDRDAKGGGVPHDRDEAVDDVILLLSQTRSSQLPCSRATGGNLSPLSTTAAVARAVPVRGLRATFSHEELEAVTARHIARAPLAEVSAFFPDWEENVRFVFQQGEAELREALRSITAALSKEDDAVAGDGVGVGVETGIGAGLGTSSGGGVREEDVALARSRSRRSGGSGSGKAKALRFFEGVVVEALKWTGSDQSPATRPVITHGDVVNKGDGGNDDADAEDESSDGGGVDADDADEVCEKPSRSDDSGGDDGVFWGGNAADRATRSRISLDGVSGSAEGRSSAESDVEGSGGSGDDGGGGGGGGGPGGGGGVGGSVAGCGVGDVGGGGGSDGGGVGDDGGGVNGDGGDDGAGCFLGDGCVDDGLVDMTQMDNAPVDDPPLAGAVAAVEAQRTSIKCGDPGGKIVCICCCSQDRCRGARNTTGV